MRRIVASLLLTLLVGAGSAAGEDGKLDALRAALAPLRQHANDRLSNDHDQTRGASPALTAAKHLMRDWIEAALAQFPENGDTATLAAAFHAGLTGAHLFCDTCFPSFLGYVDDIQVDREREYLIFRTSAGIWCGYDDSAYAYRWIAGRWQRIWEDERTAYAGGKYFPRILYAVHVSQPDRDGHRLLLTLGSRPGCSVAFQPVYYDLWQIADRRERPKVLLQASEFASVGEFPPVHGRVESDDALIEFTAGGTSYGEGHEAVRHYKLRGGRIQQLDPIAPNPRDFVEEWLASKWERSTAWSESPSLSAWHAKLHRDDGMGDFPDPTLHCSSRPDLWQVGIKLHDVPGETWYLVRSTPPGRFTMVDVAERQDPDCTEKERPNEFPRTFFPGAN